MKVIYPEETLALLAERDTQINEIVERYQRLAKQRALAHIHVPVDWQRYIREDPEYQAYMRQKARIISLSLCTYQFDVGDIINEVKD